MKILIIGAGPGGYEAALYAAKRGADVTLVEQNRLGGTCLNAGCIPTKSLLASTDALYAVEQAGNFGISAAVNGRDFAAVYARKDKVVSGLVSGIDYLMNAAKVHVVYGRGVLVDSSTVRVQKDEELFTADSIILATGSVPSVPEVFIHDSEFVLNSDEVLSLTDAPSSIIIVGGGVIGCEIGQFLRRMGSDVVIIEMMPHLLPLEDSDCAKVLERRFRRERIQFVCGKGVKTVEKTASSVRVVLEDGSSYEAQKALVATGRSPATKGIGLETAGITADKRGYIPVDDFMRTSVPGIYAIGDIVATPQLAHVAAKEGLTAVDHIFGDAHAMSYNAVPRCVYTDPEVACVGLTEDDAQKNGVTYSAGRFDFIALGKAKTSGKTDGFVKILVDEHDVVLGASITGAHATELIQTLTLAVELRLTSAQIGGCIFPHPTMSEAIMEAAHNAHSAHHSNP
jgi:dihydrolipoamide dehydrogenase